ncbi:MAG: tetratricopeptide repeat protein [Vicinamibacterales bacterium]
MKPLSCAAALLISLSAPAFAQGDRVHKLFEAGQFQQVIEAVPADAAPDQLYTAAQSHQKLGSNDQAIQIYGRLASRAEDDAWHFIGVSGQRLLEDQIDAAADAARRAVAISGNLPEAHFQLGLGLAKGQAWAEAAAAFDRTAELSPANAYAHYYGGLMHYRAGRPDRMAIHFEQFLKLAPEAPERPEVLQIMRTVRGR